MGLIENEHGVFHVRRKVPKAFEVATARAMGVPKERVSWLAGLKTPPFAVVPLSGDAVQQGASIGPQDLLDDDVEPEEANSGKETDTERPLTIAEAKLRLAHTYGVEPSNIRIIVEG
ncbi:hypothetical protein [Bradyrhizobium sp.]|uniref:hypothetical protein n=1 Tax=Bradyrhizobium sp. TaxID=376 RepID=UPI002735D790|nr:hypothetical protein [Bradyrhizobium sp.]